MRRPAACSVSVVACLAAGLAGQSTTTPQGPPVFRTSVDLIHFDVSVLDKSRKPVRGLTAADFTILEDGKPQPIVAFSAVDVPEPVRPTATWMAEVAPDVQTNEVAASPEGRLFVALIDDALIPADPWMLKKAREIAHGVIDRLSPNDQLAIVFSSTSDGAQSFTRDRARLHKAVDTTTIGFATYKMGWDTTVDRPRGQPGDGIPVFDGDARLRDVSMKTLEMVAETLVAAPQRRKALIFISPGVTVDVASAARPGLISSRDSSMSIREANRGLVNAMPRLFAEMKQANVTIYPVDPCGLGGLAGYVQNVAATIPALRNATQPFDSTDDWYAPKRPPRPMDLAQHVATISADFIMAAASNTGGVATMNTNDFTPGLNRIFDENSSYYLLGYRAPAKNAPKSVHRVSVKVNRPDVLVRTRDQYETIEPEKPDAKEAGRPALRNLMAGPVPVADLPLSVAISPVAVRDRKDAAVLIVLGMQQPATTSPTPQTIEYQISAFTPDGRPVGNSLRQSAAFTVLPGVAGSTSRYELLTQLPLPPGRYDLRIATRRSSDGVPGSLYTTIDVPNFQDAPLSLSGVSLAAQTGVSGVPQDAFESLIPFVPTAVREFGTRDVVTARFRIYQGGRDPLAPVGLRARVISDLDQTVGDAAGTLGVERFDPATRSADHRFAIPISSLAPGQYLLTFEASLDKTVVRRDVRFRIR